MGSFGPLAGSVIVGGIVGALAVKLIDRGSSNDMLKEMAKSLEPDHCLFVLLTDVESISVVERILASSGGHLISHEVDADIVAELEKAIASTKN